MNQQERAIENIIKNAGQLKDTEKLLVLSDRGTESLGEFFVKEIKGWGHKNIEHMVIEPLSVHGEDPGALVAEKFMQADLIACLTKFSLAHSNARKAATESGKRYLSLPDYNFELLSSPALEVNFFEQRAMAAKVEAILSGASQVEVCSGDNKRLNLEIAGRSVNNCDSVLDQPGSLASPPDIEVNIAPLEEKTEGEVLINGSIPHPLFGRLDVDQSVLLTFEKGFVVDIDSKDKKVRDNLENLFNKFGKKSRIVGELGFGLNPLSQLTGNMLEDEGYMGGIHLGLGSNSTIGGLNQVPFHVDFVTDGTTVKVDGKQLMESGTYVI